MRVSSTLCIQSTCIGGWRRGRCLSLILCSPLGEGFLLLMLYFPLAYLKRYNHTQIKHRNSKHRAKPALASSSATFPPIVVFSLPQLTSLPDKFYSYFSPLFLNYHKIQEKCSSFVLLDHSP